MMRFIRYTLQGLLYRHFFALFAFAVLWYLWVFAAVSMFHLEKQLPHVHPMAAIVVKPDKAHDQMMVALRANPAIHSSQLLVDSEDVKVLKSRIGLMSQERVLWPEIIEIKFVLGMKYHQLKHQIKLLQSHIGVQEVLWESGDLRQTLHEGHLRVGFMAMVGCLWLVIGVWVLVRSFMKWYSATSDILSCFRFMSPGCLGHFRVNWVIVSLFLTIYLLLGITAVLQFL